MSNLENTNINVKEIKSELSDLIEYVENNYTNREHWTVRGVGSIHYKGSPVQKTFSKKDVGSIKSIE